MSFMLEVGLRSAAFSSAGVPIRSGEETDATDIPVDGSADISRIVAARHPYRREAVQARRRTALPRLREAAAGRCRRLDRGGVRALGTPPRQVTSYRPGADAVRAVGAQRRGPRRRAPHHLPRFHGARQPPPVSYTHLTLPT